jgi:hypothetical protein
MKDITITFDYQDIKVIQEAIMYKGDEEREIRLAELVIEKYQEARLNE